jgi:UDP-N-acetyl-D-glucosamine dehydrogenase
MHEILQREPFIHMKKLVVVGQGYVGLPLAMRACEAGWDVVGYDIAGSRIERLQVGQSHIPDISSVELAAALRGGRYLATSDLAACANFDVAVITVPTPLREGNPDLSHIEAASRALSGLVDKGATVVLESTTYPGTTEELVVPILESGSGLTAGVDFHVGYSPERIDPGNETWTLVNTPKVVSGITPSSLAAVQAFYDTIVATTVPVATPKEAELAKLIENTFRHVNVALVNELAMFAADLDIDVWAAIDAASTKPFGFMRFTPGPGVGGHCLPIDPSYLSWRVKQALGHSFRFVELANDVNDHMPDYVVRRVAAALNDRKQAVNGSKVLLLGLAYKRNSGDSREAPALVVATRLLDLGADVRAADPHVVLDSHLDARIRRVEATPEEARDADAVVLLTDHDAFDLVALAEASTYFFDARNSAPSLPHVDRL